MTVPLHAMTARAAAVAAALALAGCADVPAPGAGAADPAAEAGERAAKAPLQARRYDANGDGREDLSWWNTATGQLVTWRMNGTTRLGTVEHGTFALRPFSVRSSLFGDACADTVYRADDGATALVGELVLDVTAWRCLPPARGGVHAFSPPGWRLVDVEGRYDTSGRNQLLWRSTAGTVAIWTLGDDGRPIAAGFPGSAPPDWTLLDARGDYDGDGRSDVLWRHAGGTVAVWRMTGIDTVGSTSFLGTAVPAQWTLAEGAGDFDGNRRADLLWVGTDGRVVIWSMDGSKQGFTPRSVGTIGSGWRVLDATADLDGDTRSDIVWQHASGEIVVWLMNGASIRESRSLGGLAPQWKLVARNAG